MRLLIRADGDRRIGIGHVMRTFALAERVVSDGGQATLASARLDATLAGRMQRGGVGIAAGTVDPGSAADVAWVIEEATRRGVDWVVVDGYLFDAVYQDALRAAGLCILFVDDYAPCERYAAQVVLNQNVFAAPDLYSTGMDTRYLLGPRFALLRREFAGRAATVPVIAEHASRVLLTLGGADPDNTGGLILDALALMTDPALQVQIVVGPSNPHGAGLAARGADSRITIVPARDSMAPLMAWADLAITGAGGTVYELACLGVPTMVVALADYQRDLAEALDREGFAVSLGAGDTLQPTELARAITSLLGDRQRRDALSRQGQERVDGQGAARVLEVLMETADR